MRVHVTVTYLEMDRPQVRTRSAAPRLAVRRVTHPTPTLNRYFYATVGADWTWHSRLAWSLAQWDDVVGRPGYQTWVGYLDDSPVGYFELDATGVDHAGEVELAYFGLLPTFIGRGLGAEFLASAVETAWSMPGTARLRLDTCSLDHPRALPNYLAAGFRVERAETIIDDIPDEPLEPWPNAGAPLN